MQFPRIFQAMLQADENVVDRFGLYVGAARH
jgi:hypothetical protein